MARDRDVAQNDTRNAFFRALTGSSSADVQGGSVKGMLIAAFGGSKKDGARPDTAAAAKGLGVSQRTVQRWLAAEGHQRQAPRATTLKALSTKARQAASTRAGRARAIAGVRQQLTKRGFQLQIAGVQGPQAGPGYMRLRTTGMNLDDPQVAAGFLDAWERGGDAAAQRYLIDQQVYYDSWAFESIEDISILPGSPYGSD